MEDETPNQRQARLRRERREAKLKAEGTSRLEKITKVSGRQNLPDAPPQKPTASFSSPDSNVLSPNPDQSTPFSAPTTKQSPNDPPQPTEADIRALLRSAAPATGAGDETDQRTDEDPVLKMLSQLMGGMKPGAEGAEAAPDGLPPGLAALMGSMGGVGGEGAESSAQQQELATYDYIWKIVHAIFAFALGVYVVATSKAFEGPVVRFSANAMRQDVQARYEMNLFWAFATVESVLQSTRYFLERGRTGSGVGGLIGTVSAVIPEPWGGYLKLIARYSGIWSTIVEDGCVLIFVVGMMSWWKVRWAELEV